VAGKGGCGYQGQGDGKEGYNVSKQLMDSHNQKDAFKDQLRASTPEAMSKNVPIATSHPPYPDSFRNLHDGDEFATDVVTMGGPVERPIEIRTSAILLDFFLTHAPFAVSLQDEMSIILSSSRMGYLYQAGQGTRQN
jgi:hypothetical protein